MSEYSMAEAMRQFLKQSRLKGSVLALQITEVWEEIMGKPSPVIQIRLKFMDTTLYIQTSVAPLKQELLYKKDKSGKGSMKPWEKI